MYLTGSPIRRARRGLGAWPAAKCGDAPRTLLKDCLQPNMRGLGAWPAAACGDAPRTLLKDCLRARNLKGYSADPRWRGMRGYVTDPRRQLRGLGVPPPPNVINLPLAPPPPSVQQILSPSSIPVLAPGLWDQISATFSKEAIPGTGISWGMVGGASGLLIVLAMLKGRRR